MFLQVNVSVKFMLSYCINEDQLTEMFEIDKLDV